VKRLCCIHLETSRHIHARTHTHKYLPYAYVYTKHTCENIKLRKFKNLYDPFFTYKWTALNTFYKTVWLYLVHCAKGTNTFQCEIVWILNLPFTYFCFYTKQTSLDSHSTYRQLSSSGDGIDFYPPAILQASFPTYVGLSISFSTNQYELQFENLNQTTRQQKRW